MDKTAHRYHFSIIKIAFSIKIIPIKCFYTKWTERRCKRKIEGEREKTLREQNTSLGSDMHAFFFTFDTRLTMPPRPFL